MGNKLGCCTQPEINTDKEFDPLGPPIQKKGDDEGEKELESDIKRIDDNNQSINLDETGNQQILESQAGKENKDESAQ